MATRQIWTGRKSSIGTSAVAVMSTGVKARRGVQITAPADNGSTVYIGNSSAVTADSADGTDGYPVIAGETVVIPTRNPDLLYAIAESGSDNKVWWMII